MSQIKLSARLEAIAKHIPLHGNFADVGTDHGYLPVWLLQNGYTGKLYATDIKKGPLERAKKTAAEFGFEDKIGFFLCDGLNALDGMDIRTVVIAGMGGENIADILHKAPWTKNNNCLLILQPMSKSALLRSWLFENGYRVQSEQLVKEGDVYEILTASAGHDTPYSPAELFIGHRHLISSDPLYKSRLEYLIEKTKRAASGLAESTKAEDAVRLNDMNAVFASLQELKKSEY
ncbi:MAG: SAM-dependent methyltransferase [Clostridiales bacterium]|nr:SAM-dependent methyltransferase [Clostridiales bacterium]